MRPCGLPQILHQRDSVFHGLCRFLACAIQAKLTLGAVGHASRKPAWLQGCYRLLGVAVADAQIATTYLLVRQSAELPHSRNSGSFCRGYPDIPHMCIHRLSFSIRTRRWIEDPLLANVHHPDSGETCGNGVRINTDGQVLPG
jgi:hypothetical protein